MIRYTVFFSENIFNVVIREWVFVLNYSIYCSNDVQIRIDVTCPSDYPCLRSLDCKVYVPFSSYGRFYVCSICPSSRLVCLSTFGHADAKNSNDAIKSNWLQVFHFTVVCIISWKKVLSRPKYYNMVFARISYKPINTATNNLLLQHNKLVTFH